MATLPESNGVTIDGQRRTIVAVVEERRKEIACLAVSLSDLATASAIQPKLANFRSGPRQEASVVVGYLRRERHTPIRT